MVLSDHNVYLNDRFECNRPFTGIWRLALPGRLLPVILLISAMFERPLSGKAAGQIWAVTKFLSSDGYTLNSGHSADMMLRGR